VQGILIKIVLLTGARLKWAASFIAKYIVSTLFFLTISGCATPGTAPIAGEKSTQDRIGNAIISPLGDLNIVRTTIPPVIQEALKNPYQMPDDQSCDALVAQIHQLDLVLGDDLDAPALQQEQTIAHKSGEFIRNEAIGSVERTINGAIPFRGWIRKLTGAEKRSKQVADAAAAGIVQRAFLKGIKKGLACAPQPEPLTPPVMVPSEIPAATETPEEVS